MTDKTNGNERPLPPGSTGLPLVGETLEYVQNYQKFVDKRVEKHGLIFKTHILGSPTVYMVGPEANQWIFTGENDYLYSSWTEPIKELLGDDCLAMLNGDDHRERRAQLTPHFRHSELTSFMPTINALSDEHMQAWAEQEGILTVFPAVRKLTFEIIANLLLGETEIDIPYLSELFVTWTGGMFAPVALNIPMTPFGNAIRARDEMIPYLTELIEERRKLEEQPDDIVGALIEHEDDDGNRLSTKTIVDELQLQLFAGHDTTVTVVANLILMLAHHPDVLERARAEQRELNIQDPITRDDIKQMDYLGHVIHEMLRYMPPISAAYRRTTRDVVYGNYRIPEGWTVAFSPYGTHRTDLWTDADDFDPDRWSEDRAEHKQKPFAFVAFGGGPRLCLGMNFAMLEMSIMIAKLVRDYHWELVPDQDLSYELLPFPKPESGIKVYFSRVEE